ncbi:MAG: CHAT domain-containing protein [Anaerolineales bacterium]|nr:CHAT domain-containing protein [Anaerolineales bacterium]
MEYQDFDIELTTLADGTHQVNVLDTPAGQTRQQLAFSLSDEALRDKLTQIEAMLRYKENLTAAEKRAQVTAVRAFGGSLFDALINDNLKSLYDQSRYIVRQRGQGLRLKLRIHSSLLTAVPWELLYDPRFDEFLCTSRQVSVARYVALPRPAQLMATKPPLNVLGVVAAPSNLPPLDVAFEKQQVEAALRPLVDQGLASLTWLETANRRVLLRAMNRGPWHVFHYVGHSGFDAAADEGYLSLLGDDGREEQLSADKLAMLLADHGTLRLVVLNSCMGARIGQDIYAGLATTLVRRGIPAVIGMQYDISDEAALTLAQTFYETLAENLPIETALAEARKAISLAVDESAEWGTPVFYTHAPDSVLFDVASPTLNHELAAPAEAETEEEKEASVTDQAYLTQIYELLMAHFDEAELQTLCFYLGIDYESLVGAAKPGKTRALVQYCDRAGRLADLREKVKGERPFVEWPELPKPPGGGGRQGHIVFGRQDEKATIGSWLAQEDAQVEFLYTTIAGMPGIGKSALAAAIELLPEVKDFAYHWVQLESGQEDLWSLIGQELDVQPPYQESVPARLKTDKVLLVLDGADDFVENEDLKPFLSSLQSTFRSKVILTARTFTDDPPEMQVLLEPLPLNPAVDWFLHCWRKKRSELQSDELVQLELICGPQLLDGHPLSISIVGSEVSRRRRLGKDNISQVYHELKNVIALTQSEYPNLLAEDTHVPKYSAWAAIKIAFDRLSPPAQQLMIRLAFLTNEFDGTLLKAVTRLGTNEPEEAEKWSEDLFDLSLLTYDEPRGIYKIHSIVRAFARRQFIQEEERDTLQKAVGLCMLKHTNPVYHFPGFMNLFDSSAWQDLIEIFRQQYGPVANSPLFDTSGSSEGVLRTLATYCISWALNERGLADQALAQSEDGLKQLSRMTDSLWVQALRIRFLAILANNALGKGDKVLANELIAQAISVVDFESTSSQNLLWEVGQLRLAQGRLYRQQGHLGEARSMLQAAESIYADLGDDEQRLTALSGLSTIAYDLGDLVESIRLSKEILLLLESLPDTRSTASRKAVEKTNLVEALAQKGDFVEALQWANEGLSLARERNLLWEYTALLINAAKAQIKLGKLAEAEAGLAEAFRQTLETGYESFKCELYYCRAELFLLRGQLEDALSEIGKALNIEDEIPQYTGEAQRIKGAILLAQGKHKEALETLDDLKNYAIHYSLAYHVARASLEAARVYRQMNQLTDMSSALDEAIPYFQANEMTYYLQEAENLLQQ